MITRLSLQNLKCFEAADFALAPLTLLCGQNGSGKSTVLQSLLLLRQSYLQGRLPALGLSLNGDLVKIGTARDALYEDASEDIIAFALEGEGTQLALRFSYDSESDLLRRVESLDDISEFNGPPFTAEFQYLAAERISPQVYFEAADFIVRTTRDLGTHGEYAIHFLHEFKNELITRTEVVLPAGKSDRLIDQVEAWLREFSPRIRLSSMLQTQMDLVSLQYSYETGAGTSNSYRATNVGFGLTNVLPIIIACLAMKKGGLLLIENPEVHLHPAAQVVVARLLARTAASGVQVLVETHSDHIVNGLRIAVKERVIAASDVSTIYFEPRRDSLQPQTHVLSVDENGRMSDWPTGFFDQWESALIELMD